MNTEDAIYVIFRNLERFATGEEIFPHEREAALRELSEARDALEAFVRKHDTLIP